MFFSKLTPEAIAALKGWSRRAASVVRNYLEDKFSYYLREIRFDFLPNEENEAFIVPNLPLENVKFSDTPRGTDRVASEYLAELSLDDIKAAENFYAILHRNDNQ